MTTPLFRNDTPQPGWRNVYPGLFGGVVYGSFHVSNRASLQGLLRVIPPIYAIRVKHSKRFAEYLTIIDRVSVELFGQDIFERFTYCGPAANRAFKLAIDHGYVQVERNRYRLTDKGRDYINEVG